MSQLGESSATIGNVVELITSIAERSLGYPPGRRRAAAGPAGHTPVSGGS